MNDWTHKLPTEDGVYLRKGEDMDFDDEAMIYVRSGAFYDADGRRCICHGGLWTRIGNLSSVLELANA